MEITSEDLINLGITHFNNDKYDLAIECLSGLLDDSIASYYCGYSYLKKGTEQDRIKAKQYFEASYKMGNIDAIYMLGLLYNDYEPVDKKQGYNYFKLSHEKGDVRGTYRYALHKLYGQCTAKNIPLAIELLEQGYGKGNMDCMRELAGMYLKAWHVEKNIYKSLDLYHELVYMDNNNAGLLMGAFAYLITNEPNGLDIVKNLADHSIYASGFFISHWIQKFRLEYPGDESAKEMFEKAVIAYKNKTLSPYSLNDFLAFGDDYLNKIYECYAEEYITNKSQPDAKNNFLRRIADLSEYDPERFTYDLLQKVSSLN